MAESNKTEKATPKKRKDERKKGNVFQSKDVVSLAMIILGFFLLSRLGSFIFTQLGHFYSSQMVRASAFYRLTPAAGLQIMREGMAVFFMSALPLAVAMMLTGILATGVQTRFLVAPELLKFKYSRISLLQGFKRMLSVRSLVQLGKSLIKVAIIFWIIYTGVRDFMVVTPDMLNTGMEENLEFLFGRVMSMVYKIAVIFIGVAVLDFAYQKYDYEKKLRMTKQEIKDEYKQTEGDPFIKGRIKEKQRKMSMNRMIQQVPQADVVVRNPTRYAVALRYDIEKDPAPLVVAKGRDHMARRILAEAARHQVPETENRPLARSLYDSAEAGEYIPAELYQAVAEVMAWVYNMKEKEKAETNQ